MQSILDSLCITGGSHKVPTITHVLCDPYILRHEMSCIGAGRLTMVNRCHTLILSSGDAYTDSGSLSVKAVCRYQG